jgi:hypothetical protein
MGSFDCTYHLMCTISSTQMGAERERGRKKHSQVCFVSKLECTSWSEGIEIVLIYQSLLDLFLIFGNNSCIIL